MAIVKDLCRHCERQVDMPIEAVSLDLSSGVITWVCPSCGLHEFKQVTPVVIDVLAVEGASLTWG
jgi:hypothetical protein